jgi:hypothetical protein
VVVVEDLLEGEAGVSQPASVSWISSASAPCVRRDSAMRSASSTRLLALLDELDEARAMFGDASDSRASSPGRSGSTRTVSLHPEKLLGAPPGQASDRNRNASESTTQILDWIRTTTPPTRELARG